MGLTAPGRHPVTLGATHPNPGVEAAYRERLDRLVDEMQNSLVYWLTAAWRRNENRIHAYAGLAEDISPTADLQKVMDRLAQRWQDRFDEGAKDLAAYFAQAAASRSDAHLESILRRSGFSIKFRPTRAQLNAFNAVVQENVELIKTIAAQHLSQVQGLVMRSVTRGGDLKTLSTELHQRYGVTKRRAGFIARDQNAKATSVMTKARQIEMGLEDALWLHSHGGHTPRPTHLANDGKPFKIAVGWYDPAVKKHIQPGELPNCGCLSRAIIPGFS